MTLRNPMKYVCLISFSLAFAGSFGQPTPTHLDYTVSEGTWISLDVSPNGKQIVFELVGDLYVIPIEGGEARRLAAGRAFQSQPRYSPNGNQIAFISDESGSENIWVMNADGTNPHQITKLTHPFLMSPEWSADGKHIYVTQTDGQGMRGAGLTKGEAELLAYDATTGVGQRIVSNTSGPQSYLVSSCAPGPYISQVSGDGNHILYTLVRPRAYGVRQGASSQVVRHQVATHTEERLSLDGANPMKAMVSPDGKWLVYGAENRGLAGFRLRDLNTGEEKWLKPQAQRSELEARGSRDMLPNFDFTPDSRYVIAAYQGKLHRLEIATGKDEVIPFTARVEMDLPPAIHVPTRLNNATVAPRIYQHLALSDKGLAAVSVWSAIHLIDLRNGKIRKLNQASATGEFMPAWSHDNKYIAYVTWGPEGGHVWKIDAAGKGPAIQLTTKPGMYLDPAWSADDKEIVALYTPLGPARAIAQGPFLEMMRAPETEIIHIDIASTTTTSWGRANGARLPHASSDGRWYLSAPEGLVSVNKEGKDRKVQLKVERSGPPTPIPQFQKVLSNKPGSRIAIVCNERLYQINGATPSFQTANPPPGSLLSDRMPRSITFSPSGNLLGWIEGATLYWKEGEGQAKSIQLNLEKPVDKPEGYLLLRNARLIRMQGKEIIDPGDVLIEGDRIKAIGKSGTLPVPAGTITMDMTGKVIVPGFIDMHAHAAVRSELIDAYNPALLANLSFGITSMRDPQNGPDMLAYADAIDAGDMIGPRVFTTGPSFLEINNIQSLDEARWLVGTYHKNYNNRFIKLYLPGTRQQRQWFIQACLEFNMMPTMEAGGDAKEVITHFLDGAAGNEHTLSTAPVYQDLIQLFAKSQTVYTPTLLVSFGAALPIYRLLAEERPYDDPRVNYFSPDDVFQTAGKRVLWFPDEEMNYRETGAGAGAVLKAGGHAALGGHGEMQGMSNHWEMKLLQDAGVPQHDILRMATSEGAYALGLDQDLGSLTPGKLADLVILEKDPLIDIRFARTTLMVMKNGRLYQSSNLEEVWPRKRKINLWWQSSAKP